MSRLPPACKPPEIMLTIGIGKAGSVERRPRVRCRSLARRQSRFRWTNSSSPRAAAAACATASETPSKALAPSRLLFGVPSSSISLASSADLIVQVHARDRRGDHLVTFSTALKTPRPP